mgnify:CR=1 FL=1
MHTKWLALGLIFGLNTATQAEIALNESADSVVSVLQQSKYWGLIQPGTACVEQYQFLLFFQYFHPDQPIAAISNNKIRNEL